MRKMIAKILKFTNWFKTLFFIVRNYKHDISLLKKRMTDATQLIKDRTTVHADITPSNSYPHTIVLIGEYRNRDYVNVHHVDKDLFRTYIENLSDYNKHYGRRGRIDVPPTMDCVIDNLIKGEY